MAKDPYQILGVAKTASQKDIQTAYRKLAKTLHPDLNPGDTAAEEKFKAVSAAYAILGDEDKRKRFDAGEIDAEGAERPRQDFYRDYAHAGADGGRYTYSGGFSDFGDAEDLLSGIFGRRNRSSAFRGQDRHYSLPVDFLDAINGGSVKVNLPEGGALDLRIPPGTRDGQTLRLKGKGEPGFNGGPAGDALVDITVKPHPYFVRDGDDIRLDVPVTLKEAVLGAKIRVPTPSGAVSVTLPPGSSSGKMLRLKGKGVKRGATAGDVYITVKIVLPETPDPALEAFLRDWTGGGDDPRRTMGV